MESSNTTLNLQAKNQTEAALPLKAFPFVDVVVVLWHSVPYLEQLFDGLAATDYPKASMAVHFVDNCPGDGSLVEVKKQQERLKGTLPEIVLHEPGTNTGFSGGNNLVMRKSIADGHAYTYLLNHDASFEMETLSAAVAVAESDARIGSVQSLIVLQQKPTEVNSIGNAIHFLGFGYCAGYHEARADVSPVVTKIAYGSGAGVLFRNCVLQEVGLLDETLFLYHEDLDLGWRILLSGFNNVLAPKSVLRHRYEFSRSMEKYFWMERNRVAVVLKNYQILTVILLVPLLIATDFALLAFAVKGGWWRDKLRAMAWFFKSSSWAYILNGREKIARLRRVSDRQILNRFTPYIAYQEFETDLVKHIANPFWKISLEMIKFMIRW